MVYEWNVHVILQIYEWYIHLIWLIYEWFIHITWIIFYSYMHGNNDGLRIYLWSDQVAHCQWERQHDESNSITGKFCTVCFLDKHLQKVSGIFRGNRYSRLVSLKSVSQALEYPCNSLIGYKWMLSFSPFLSNVTKSGHCKAWVCQYTMAGTLCSQ